MMPDMLSNFWAKSPTQSGEEGESLTKHIEDVLSSLSERRARNPVLFSLLNRENLWDVVAWACIFHDLGKVSAGFQTMLRGENIFLHRHEVLSLVPAGWLDVTDDILKLFVSTIATHHKTIKEIFTLYPFEPNDARIDILNQFNQSEEEVIYNWLSGNELPDLARWGFNPLPPLNRISKERAFARSMRILAQTDEEIEKMDATNLDSLLFRYLRGLIMLSDHAGSAHEKLRQVQVFNNPHIFRSYLSSNLGQHLYYHQWIASRTRRHAILIAPTGSGKTESALLWAAKQNTFYSGKPSIFYILPYRASLNAMRARMTIKYGVPDDSIVLQHASATSAIYNYFLSTRTYKQNDAIRAANLERRLSRLMTASVRVLTPYQLLKAFFGLPGHEAIITDATGSLFILDELHAYDIGRLSLILSAIKQLSETGASFFIMSATFPKVLLDALICVLDQQPKIIKADICTLNQFKRHTCRLTNANLTDKGSIQLIIDRYSHGDAVLVVTTTVERSKSIYQEIKKQIGNANVELLHSRFTHKDRNYKETKIERIVSTGKRNSGMGGFILVATQVVEVSLDVDFDVLFSDPAPIESLIQRFGRINRLRRKEPCDVIVYTEIPSEGDGVYVREFVENALEILRPYQDKIIDETNVQEWVDASYSHIAIPWTRELTKKINEIQDSVLRVNRPLINHPELESRFNELFDGFEVIPYQFFTQYKKLLKQNPIEASSLFVPISHQQAKYLRRRGLLTNDLCVNLDYNSEIGLILDFSDNNA